MESEQVNNIPGTILNRDKMDGATGLEFLDKVFFITDKINARADKRNHGNRRHDASKLAQKRLGRDAE